MGEGKRVGGKPPGLHRDPSIISRLYAAYALARWRPDFSTVSYFTPRATLSSRGACRIAYSTLGCQRRPTCRVGPGWARWGRRGAATRVSGSLAPSAGIRDDARHA